jgi:NADPH-dependent 2,4-dienoyl-CoA reductase/sulfur reductase-like enzyme
VSVPAEGIVIVGAGLAASSAVEALLELGFAPPVTVIGDEAAPPYERPPLSKGYLTGEADFDSAVLHPAEWYAEHGVELRMSTTVTAVDPAAHTVRLHDGTSCGYGKLLLATGARPRRLEALGANAPNVYYLRGRTHAEAIRAELGEGRRLVVIGGGWLGLEVASAARGAGTETVVVEAADAPLLTVLGAQMGAVFRNLHEEHGVRFRLGRQPSEVLVRDGLATGVRLDDGAVVAADAVVVCIGAEPDTWLAAAAGIAVDNGVLVDATLRTCHPDVYAAGDVANHAHPTLGQRIRVEHWANARGQGRAAAAAMLDGAAAPYDELPYFFSDQYDLGMEFVGHLAPGHHGRLIVRGDVPGREFLAFWLDAADRMQAALAVNSWDVLDGVRPLIAEGAAVDAAPLAAPAVAPPQAAP